jgi:hypothetical protein
VLTTAAMMASKMEVKAPLTAVVNAPHAKMVLHADRILIVKAVHALTSCAHCLG